MQDIAKEKDLKGKMKWDNLNKYLVNANQEEIDFDIFQTLYDNDPSLQELVKDFNKDYIILKVNDDDDGESELPEPDRNKLHKTAVKTAKRHLK